MVRRAARAGEHGRAGDAARERTLFPAANGRPVFPAALARAGRGVCAFLCKCLCARAQRGGTRRGDGGRNAFRAREARLAGGKARLFLVGFPRSARSVGRMDSKSHDAECELSRTFSCRAALADECFCGYPLVAVRARRFRRLPARRTDYHAPAGAVPSSGRAAPRGQEKCAERPPRHSHRSPASVDRCIAARER